MSVMLKIVVGLAVILGAAYVVLAKGGAVSGAEARRLVDAGARLVDVRTPAEFAEGHIAGAVNIPVQELDRRLAELEPKDKPIVVYCHSGRRSANAARTLERAGFSSVHDLGAMTRW